MDNKLQKTPWQKALHFFITKMIVGVAMIVLLVVAVEWLRTLILDKTDLTEGTKALVTAIMQALVATMSYIFLFKKYDNRTIHELSGSTFFGNASKGLLIGIGLQFAFIIAIYFIGTYLIVRVNPVSFLINPLAFAVSAGFVAEIILVGIVFRLLELQTGTLIAIIAFMLLFAILHVHMKGASVVSITATAVQAGLLLPAAFVYSRSLWLPIFLHLGWDLAEPGIFGGINPSGSLTQGLLTSKIEGSYLLTGAEAGPQNSLTSLLLCLTVGLIFLILANRKGNWIKASWQKPPGTILLS